MTLSTTVNRTRTQGNGVTVTFHFPYYFLADGDLVVIYTDANGLETTLVQDTDYTVAGAGVISGGSITLIGTYAASPPAASTFITISRDPDITQETDYTENDPFAAETHEQALDRLTMICQALKEVLDRSLRLAQSSAYSALTLPDPAGGSYLRWKADVSGLENITTAPAALDPNYYGATMTGNESFAYPGSDYCRCFLDPGGADRNFDPAAGFPSGFELVVVNTGEELVTVDSTGLAMAVGPGQVKAFYFDGTAWKGQA
jgi:hypothetical protein